jgi:peroxiredoxin
LRGIEKNLASLEGMSVRPVAISVESPSDSNELCRKAGLTYTVLSDQSKDTIRHYDLLTTVDGQDVAGAAEFLVDPSGIRPRNSHVSFPGNEWTGLRDAALG